MAHSSWLERFRLFLARRVFSTLAGITFGTWWRLLRKNRFRVAPSCWPRAALITTSSIWNLLLRRLEDRLHGAEVAATEIAPPLFVLGHWRSGTTHLHNLLSVDPRFAFPNVYQVLFPHTFLLTEGSAKLWAPLITQTRVIDNMTHGFQVPFEDEFATFVATGMSPFMCWTFPQEWEYYARYLTFRGASADEVSRWKAALLQFVKKLTWKYRRPLLLKSPGHTCRIRLLLEMFPEARFVHIHRDPYTVFQSIKRTTEISVEIMRLQKFDRRFLVERILDNYRSMYDVFFEERGLIPAGRFHEMGFEDLEKDCLGMLRELYDRLALPGFEEARPLFERYIQSQAGYRKNEHPDVSPDHRRRIAESWRRSFTEWGYEL